MPSQRGDNDWLRLTGDDQHHVEVRWSVGMRRVLLAAVISGVAAGAQAADMPDFPILRGGFTEGPAAATGNWQGYYIGGGRKHGKNTPKPPFRGNKRLPTAFRPPPRATAGQPP